MNKNRLAKFQQRRTITAVRGESPQIQPWEEVKPVQTISDRILQIQTKRFLIQPSGLYTPMISTKKIKKEIHYLFKKQVKKRLLIGGILTVTSILIIPLIYLSGYYTDIIEKSINSNSSQPPKFRRNVNHIKSRMKDGLNFQVILSLHMMPVFTLLTVVIANNLRRISSPPTEQQITTLTISLGIAILFSILYSVLIIPASQIIFVRTNSLVEAFNPFKIYLIITNKSYLKVYAIAVAIGLPIIASSTLLGNIPILGLLLVAIIQFIVFSTAFRLLAIGAEDNNPLNIRSLSYTNR